MDIGVAQPEVRQSLEKQMLGVLHAITFPHLGAEEGADTGFNQDVAVRFLYQQDAAAKVDAILLIGWNPAFP